MTRVAQTPTFLTEHLDKYGHTKSRLYSAHVHTSKYISITYVLGMRGVMCVHTLKK